MISAEAARTLARYNAWQNKAVLAWASAMSETERARDRGAFWGSVKGTLNHLLWGDSIWMHRLAGLEKPDCALAGSGEFEPEWEKFTAARQALDNAILAWTAGLQDVDLEGDLVWFSAAEGRELAKPRWICALQLFNHQTHHRGQLHAMATAAGFKTEPTDLPFMPE